MPDVSIQALADALPRLPLKDHGFAASLISQASRRPLSDKQLYWVGKLIEKANPKPRETVEIGDFAGIAKLFETAREHLKYPKIVINGLVLKMAGDRARVPGSVNVLQEDTRDWYGRILQDGRFEKSGRTYPDDQVVDILKAFAADPAGEAAKHGKLTGNCCFCRKTLTAENSTDVGYGPVCAKNYGLPWGGPKAAATSGLFDGLSDQEIDRRINNGPPEVECN